MSGKRQLLIDCAEWGHVMPIARRIHDRGRQSLVVLAYHRVMPLESAEAYPFDLDLISATPAEFEWQMRWIRDHYAPVSLQDVVDHMDGGVALPPKAVAVTFDDGFRDTYLHAFPVLKRLKIPATVFVTTGYVDSGEPFWFELVAYLMMHIEPSAIRIEEVEEAFPSGASTMERRASLRRLHDLLKSLPNARRAAMIHEWTARFVEGFDASTSELSRPLTWGQIREMSGQGIDFGSHTLSHPNLTQLPDPDLYVELTESRQVLEQQVAHPVSTIAYPIGTQAAYDPRVMRAAEQAGYRLGVTYVSGVNWATDDHRFDLRRHGVNRTMTRSYFRAMLALPGWIR